uniref:Uncharacterized protein AlNc14C111G6389 n=1 Tax=Albugo laibachii Nc14 TaxID=890382 RepID=F0WII9_9STRA|nr:conserved hypothetical protein [Albugo laibachii Nc14]|eukprot:CCA21071.1 conserved hypothetical protein [Albugo laibachii Nc14]
MESSYPIKIASLLQWLRSKSVTTDSLHFQKSDGHEGVGVYAAKSLQKGEITMEIPFHLTISKVTAMQSDLRQILQDKNELDQDEIVALFLMIERFKSSDSFFEPFIQSLPSQFDLPIFWNDSDFAELEGTNVALLAKIMRKQIEADFQAIHIPLLRAYEERLNLRTSEISISDYEWALSIIWTRAFGITRYGEYLRVLCPALDMFNHSVLVQEPLDEFIKYDHMKDVLAHCVVMETSANDPFYISYGSYSDAKLLYSYGFVSLNEKNRFNGIDLWMRVPVTDPNFKLKQAILEGNAATRDQTYDFRGTIHLDDVDERFLASFRIILLSQEEFREYEKAFDSTIVSVRNELAVYAAIHDVCEKRLARFPTSLEDDLKKLAELEMNSDLRKTYAISVRMEDKKILQSVCRLMKEWRNLLENDSNIYPPDVTRQQQPQLSMPHN